MGNRSPKHSDEFSRDTERELELGVTPDHARVYVAPRTIPPVTEHETVETETVAVQPRIDRRAETMPSMVRRTQHSRERSRAAAQVALIAVPILVGVITALILAELARQGFW